jgi:phosphoglucosamine mutase
MTGRKYFGTDGIRGEVGQFPITPEFVLKLGWAAGKVFAQAGRGKVLIGKDTRISGYMFESALESGLSAAGVSVGLLGPMPTPAIAYLTRTFYAQAGIVISASHNPYHDNGIKFFSAEGTKLPDAVEMEIESYLEKEMTTVASAQLGKATRVVDAPGRYIEFCKSTIPQGMNFNGLRIVIDCADGATYNIAPKVFSELGADIIQIGVSPDGLNINENSGSTKPELLQKTVLAEKANLGIAFDGDGDRLIMVDDQGDVIDGDEILFMIARAYHQAGSLNGGVVGTVMSNLGLELAFADLNIPFVRTSVGDRYVVEELRRLDWCLGGESSGHIVCRDVTCTGDGIVSALQVLVAMQQRGESLRDCKQGMHKCPQRMINVKMAERKNVVDLPVVQQAVQVAEARLGSKGRVLLRPSGTEPVVRVMVEGEDETLVDSVVAELADVVTQAVQ